MSLLGNTHVSEQPGFNIPYAPDLEIKALILHQLCGTRLSRPIRPRTFLCNPYQQSCSNLERKRGKGQTITDSDEGPPSLHLFAAPSALAFWSYLPNHSPHTS
jgi:hypothetical protein